MIAQPSTAVYCQFSEHELLARLSVLYARMGTFGQQLPTGRGVPTEEEIAQARSVSAQMDAVSREISDTAQALYRLEGGTAHVQQVEELAARALILAVRGQ